MTTKAKAQSQYLRLISKLYDMASQFDADELRAVLKIAEDESNRPVVRAVQAMLMLVSDHKDSGVVPRIRLGRVSPSPPKYPSSLYELFSSKDIFSSAKSVVDVLPFEFELKEKESRDRFSRRLVTYINELPVEQKDEVLEKIHSSLSSKLGGGFVSSWSKLIRRL